MNDNCKTVQNPWSDNDGMQSSNPQKPLTPPHVKRVSHEKTNTLFNEADKTTNTLRNEAEKTTNTLFNETKKTTNTLFNETKKTTNTLFNETKNNNNKCPEKSTMPDTTLRNVNCFPKISFTNVLHLTNVLQILFTIVLQK